MRLTPTDVTQFVRFEQCERFLRFRLAERAGQKFMIEYDVNPQRITPLLSLSGHDFEKGFEETLGKRYAKINYAEKSAAHNRPSNNLEVLEEARKMAPGKSILLFQPRLDVELHGWLLRGDVDLIKLDRSTDGTLHVLIVDMKSTVAVKVEHRLQVAFYRIMLEKIFEDAGISPATMQTGIFLRPPIEPTREEELQIKPQKDAAKAIFGLDESLLEIVADGDAYVQSAYDLVLAEDSTARRVAGTSFEAIPYCLSFKCDGCLYNEFCLKWSAEQEDLSLLPYMTGTEKEALRRAGITTVQALANLKDFVSGKIELVSASGRETLVKQIAATWPVGSRLDELIHRAKSFRKSVRKDGTQALSYIPGKGNSSLPVATPEINPNLVRIYLDAQHDYLEGRVYLLGALVVACKDGTPVTKRSVVRLTDGPPDTAAKERQLFVEWTKDLLKAVVEIADSNVPPGDKKSAPLHIIFFDRNEQRLMLEGLARNFPPIIHETPPLYDFLTQIAAFDSPIASFLDEEIRTFKNYPMTCQSLQSVAAYLKFDWTTPHNFRELFKARVFDYIGKLETDGTSEWFTRRSRFASSVPLEYAYSAWGELPMPAKGKGDVFALYRDMTKELVTAFEQRRLEALEHVTNSINGNPFTEKTPFDLPDLAHYEDKAHDLAHALHEFVTIERLVTLNDWKAIRHAPPERRVLMGEALLVRYCEADQVPGIAEQNRENERRRQKREEYAAAFRAANPDKQFRLKGEQAAECKWSQEGMRFRLRIETAGVDCDLHEALLLSTLREGDRLVLIPRWTVDERLPVDERKEFTPTPKQMLYGQRADLVRIVATKKDETGRVIEAFAEVELKESRGGDWSIPYVFSAFSRTLEADKCYTLDPCPNEWYAYWCAQVVNSLCAGSPNTLYNRLVHFPDPGDGSGSPGQKAFLAGLDAFHQCGLLHDFEASKREFIGKHARTPVLLIQGPPGTGKSYCAAFAIFARLQGAMKEGQPCRVFLSCKTHAATDVLLVNVLEVQQKLRELQSANPELFAKHFDKRILEVPLFRVAPRDLTPDGVIPLAKEGEKERGEDYNADLIEEHQWAVVAVTPGGTYGMVKGKWPKNIFGHELCDLLVLDEASQMSLPEALMAALPLKPGAPLVVVGDHRQMPPIVKHNWQDEARRTFQQYQVYESLFDTLRAKNPPIIRFAESFRLHAAMAEFLRQEVYRHDGIAYHSKRTDMLAIHSVGDEMAAAVLLPNYPLIVVVHDEAESQMRNVFEQKLIEPILRALADPKMHSLDAVDGMGIVVPHRSQRAALQLSFPELCINDAITGMPVRSAIDTVERFQGGERTVIMVSATESDRAYLLASSQFLLDPRRLTVALSRAKRKMILVASRSIFSLFSPDEETFANSMLWKNLLKACPTLLWAGDRAEKRVMVWGGNLVNDSHRKSNPRSPIS
jgi:hypothetical protein